MTRGREHGAVRLAGLNPQTKRNRKRPAEREENLTNQGVVFMMVKKSLIKKIGTTLLAGTMLATSTGILPGLEKKAYAQDLPLEFSLEQWMTPIQRQRYALCYDYAAIALIESKLKMMVGNTSYNPNLSEQQYPCYDGDYYNGGNGEVVLDYAKKTGIVEEKTLPFVGPSSSCEIPENAKRYFVKSHEVYFPWRDSLGNPETIRNRAKQYLIEKGPVLGTIRMSGGIDINGIYKCNGSVDGGGHNIVVYGYKDTGNIHTSYWKIKDSNNYIDKIGMDAYLNDSEEGLFGYFDQCELTLASFVSVEMSQLNHLANTINTLKVLTSTPVNDLNVYETDCNKNGIIDIGDAICSMQKEAELR